MTLSRPFQPKSPPMRQANPFDSTTGAARLAVKHAAWRMCERLLRTVVARAGCCISLLYDYQLGNERSGHF
jgi:hypothetical protein